MAESRNGTTFTFLAKPPHHGAPKHTRRLVSTVQHDRSAREILHRGSDNFGIPTPPCQIFPVLNVRCWEELPCQSASQFLNEPGVLPNIFADEKVSQQLSSALNSCTQLWDSSNYPATSTIGTGNPYPNPSPTSSATPSPDTSLHTESTASASANPTSPLSSPTATYPTSVTARLASPSQSLTNSLSTSGDAEGSGSSPTGPLTPRQSDGSSNVGAPGRSGSSSFQSFTSTAGMVSSGISSAPRSSISVASSPGASAMPPDSEAHHHHHLNIGAVVGIALAVILTIALVIFFLVRRRAHRRSRRTSFKSSWKRLEADSYDDGRRSPASSIWTWFASVDVDPDFEPKSAERLAIEHTGTLDFRHAPEKDARSGSGAYTPRLSPYPSPAPAVTRPLARDMSSVHSLHDGLPHPNIQIPIPSAPAASSTSELLALAGTDFRGAVDSSNRAYGYEGLERKASDVSNNSHTTARSGDVQSVEAL